MSARARIAVLASGNGSNMQAIAEACARGDIDAEIVLVIANEPEAGVLARARRLGIPHTCIDHRDFADRAAFDAALRQRLRAARARLVVLAGFMRILTDEFVGEFCGSLLNIHPSLLPNYPGLDTHRRALAAGDTRTGATVHFVIPALDAGPAIIQEAVSIRADDDAASLAARVQAVEHRIYPTAIRWWVEGRLELRDSQAWLDGEAIFEPGKTEKPRIGTTEGGAGGGVAACVAADDAGTAGGC